KPKRRPNRLAGRLSAAQARAREAEARRAEEAKRREEEELARKEAAEAKEKEKEKGGKKQTGKEGITLDVNSRSFQPSAIAAAAPSSDGNKALTQYLVQSRNFQLEKILQIKKRNKQQLTRRKLSGSISEAYSMRQESAGKAFI
ncbi:hypothetical protein THAOC_10137, partial [Thalassiosira oceanica]